MYLLFQGSGKLNKALYKRMGQALKASYLVEAIFGFYPFVFTKMVNAKRIGQGV